VAGECLAGAAGADTIQFAIPGSGVKTIFLVQELPVITEALTINGFTQTGASANTNATGGLNTVLTVELNGSAPPPVSSGSFIIVTAGPTTIRGLAFTGGGAHHSAISIGGTGTHVEGCFIGTNVFGTAAAGNVDGVILQGGSGHVIGGPTPDTRNLISGNTNFGLAVDSVSTITIQGNLIGTDAAGTSAIANASTPISVASSPNDTIAGNVIVGSPGPNGPGILLSGSLTSGTTVTGNFIGTNATGTAAIPNAGAGIAVRNGSHNNTIGGTTAAARNVISGNGLDGIDILDIGCDNNVVQGNFIGTNAAGTGAIGNGQFGILVAFNVNNTIGGTVAGAGNTI